MTARRDVERNPGQATILVGPGLEFHFIRSITTSRVVFFPASFPMSVIRSLDYDGALPPPAASATIGERQWAAGHPAVRAQGIRTEGEGGKSGRGAGEAQESLVFAIKRYHFHPGKRSWWIDRIHFRICTCDVRLTRRRGVERFAGCAAAILGHGQALAGVVPASHSPHAWHLVLERALARNARSSFRVMTRRWVPRSAYRTLNQAHMPAHPRPPSAASPPRRAEVFLALDYH